MVEVDIVILIDSRSMGIEYCRLEGMSLNPKTHFVFKEGYWRAVFQKFPLKGGDLDLLIVTYGNPGEQSEVQVFFGKKLKGKYDMYKPFNKSGYGQFNESIPV